MSKFCGNCGAQLDDNVRVCGYCGNPISNETVRSKSIPGIVSEADKEKVEKIKKLAKPVGMAVAAIIVFSLFFSFISSVTGYKGVVRKVINAFEDYNIKTLYKYTSELAYPGFDDEDDIMDSIEDRVSSNLDYYEDKVGSKMKVKYEIISADKFEKRKLDNLKEYYEEYDVDVDDIKAVRQVKLKLEFKGKEGKKSVTTNDFLLIKEGSKWKVLYTGMRF